MGSEDWTVCAGGGGARAIRVVYRLGTTDCQCGVVEREFIRGPGTNETPQRDSYGWE